MTQQLAAQELRLLKTTLLLKTAPKLRAAFLLKMASLLRTSKVNRAVTLLHRTAKLSSLC